MTTRRATLRRPSREFWWAASTFPTAILKFAYKLRWFDRLIDHARYPQTAGVPAVLAGDFNVVPTDGDIYSMRSWTKNALVQPEPRAAFAKLLSRGWTDSLAELDDNELHFTFWAYLRNSWARDAGLRIDHLLVSRALVHRLADAGVDRETRGRAGASDHAPAWIELTSEPDLAEHP